MKQMKIKKYLMKVQKIQRDYFDKLVIKTDTSLGDDYKAVHCSVFEYNYEKVEEATGDYTIRTFNFYTFNDKQKNDKVMNDLYDYIEEQKKKWTGQ